MNAYLQKRALYPAWIITPPDPNLGIVVVIPCYDEPDLIASLEALKACNPPAVTVEVIVVINHSEKEKPEVKARNLDTLMQAEDWAGREKQEWIRFHFISATELPAKKAGVGLARKIGMDEAVRRFASAKKADGIIACFDADTQCEANYFQALETHFAQHPKQQAVSIQYAHPCTGAAFAPEVYGAIIDYELHLRYFTLAKRQAGYPHAYETIGSSMAVRSSAYQQQGGMNLRKAGEDFYFLNKFMIIDTLGELHTTTVIPSPRRSHRVPFGTGKAVGEMIDQIAARSTYAPATFLALEKIVSAVPEFYTLSDLEMEHWLEEQSPLLKQFLVQLAWRKRVAEIKQHTRTAEGFYKRFFRWFDPFQVMKFAHFSRDHFHPNVPIPEAVNWLLTKQNAPLNSIASARDQLLFLRAWMGKS